MNRIEKLIKEKCPDGVRRVKLGEVCDILNGFAFQSKKYVDSGIRVIRISDVQDGYISNNDKKFYPLSSKMDILRYLLKEGDLVISLTGNVGRVAFITTKEIPAALNQRVACFRPQSDLLIRYLYHLLFNDEFQKTAMDNANGAGQKNLSTTWLSNYTIPLPPLSIQQEIVEILDSFTALQQNLEDELKLRQKQYEHYREKLLTFEDGDVEWKKLGEVFTFKNGLNKGKEYFGSGRPIIMFSRVFNNRALYEPMIDSYVDITESELSRINANRGDVFFTRTSETQEDVGMASVLLDDIKGCTYAGFLIRARPINDCLLPEYCKYCFTTSKMRSDIVSKSIFTTRASLTGTGLSEISIPVPSLEHQSQIIQTLDHFESLISNLKTEIELRKKQYEYYREKLLTF